MTDHTRRLVRHCNVCARTLLEYERRADAAIDILERVCEAMVPVLRFRAAAGRALELHAAARQFLGQVQVVDAFAEEALDEIRGSSIAHPRVRVFPVLEIGEPRAPPPLYSDSEDSDSGSQPGGECSSSSDGPTGPLVPC